MRLDRERERGEERYLQAAFSHLFQILSHSPDFQALKKRGGDGGSVHFSKVSLQL